jgi:hypothetical protein
LPVPTKMSDLSITAASNSPAGSEAPISTDDFHRAIQAILRTTNAKGSDIASATTTDIGAATGEFVDVTGTTTITGLGTIAAGIVRTVRFTGALTLTHNGTSLILPRAANMTTAANQVFQFRSLGSGNWICVGYTSSASTGSNSDITSLNATGGIDIIGTNTNDNAATGYVGEYLSSQIVQGSAAALTTNTALQLTSLSLTAGDWDVEGHVAFSSTSASFVNLTGWIDTSGTYSNDFESATRVVYQPSVVLNTPGSGIPKLAINRRRFSLSGTTSVYLYAQAGFTVAAAVAYGFISARRVR